MADQPVVEHETAAGVATITLDNPAKRNALSAQLSSELHAALTEASADSEVRAIVLTHTGPVFCAGADLKERAAGVFPEFGPGALLSAIAESPKLVIARLAGSARAGGVGLAAACDLSVIDEEATFAFTEVRLGLVPATIAAVVVPRVGHSRAAELFVTGRRFSAADAVEWGLYTATTAIAEIDTQVGAWLDAIGTTEPIATGATKALLRGLSGFADAEHLARLEAESITWFKSPGGLEGMASFAEKRPPGWVSPLGEAYLAEQPEVQG